MADERRMRGDDELDVREVFREPEADAPLPRRVQMRVDLIYKHHAGMVHDDTAASLLNKQQRGAEALRHLPNEFESEREHRSEAIGKGGDGYRNTVAVGEMNV